MSEREDEVLRGIIEVLEYHLGPSKIILFGSRARGTDNPQTDFDLAVDCLKPELSTQRTIREEIDKISGLYKVDVVYLSSVDEKFKDIILKTGKVVYEERRT